MYVDSLFFSIDTRCANQQSDDLIIRKTATLLKMSSTLFPS